MSGKHARRKVLIVDDEPSIRLMVKKIFEKEYEVLEAENGKKGVDIALRHLPDVILMDMIMPETDGLTALNTLRNDKRGFSIPVIMFTGANFELNEALARDLGASAYLRKPVSAHELVEAVHKII